MIVKIQDDEHFRAFFFLSWQELAIDLACPVSNYLLVARLKLKISYGFYF